MVVGRGSCSRSGQGRANLVQSGRKPSRREIQKIPQAQLVYTSGRAGGGSGGGLDRGVGVRVGHLVVDEDNVFVLGRELYLTLVPPSTT